MLIDENDSLPSAFVIIFSSLSSRIEEGLEVTNKSDSW